PLPARMPAPPSPPAIAPLLVTTLLSLSWIAMPPRTRLLTAAPVSTLTVSAFWAPALKPSLSVPLQVTVEPTCWQSAKAGAAASRHPTAASAASERCGARCQPSASPRKNLLPTMMLPAADPRSPIPLPLRCFRASGAAINGGQRYSPWGRVDCRRSDDFLHHFNVMRPLKLLQTGSRDRAARRRTAPPTRSSDSRE